MMSKYLEAQKGDDQSTAIDPVEAVHFDAENETFAIWNGLHFYSFPMEEFSSWSFVTKDTQ